MVSARISECGYAWVVCGRRLLVWQYKKFNSNTTTTPLRKQVSTNQCYELQLPQSDLAHRAELVSVYFNNGSQTACCIAVSPEGKYIIDIFVKANLAAYIFFKGSELPEFFLQNMSSLFYGYIIHILLNIYL